MAVLLSADAQSIPGPLDVLTTEETLVVTGSSLSLTSDHAKALVRGWIDLDVPAGTTAVSLTVYEGEDITGRLAGKNTADASASVGSVPAHFEIEIVDVLQNVGGAQYAMSVTLTGALSDGTVSAALLNTTLLSG